MSEIAAQVKDVSVADVYKSGRLAAQLRRSPHETQFSYLPHYREVGESVATTLPLSDVALSFPPGAIPPFFAGLLPEGRRLTALRRMVKTSADDEFSLILAVGSDPVGDVQIVPEGRAPVAIEPLIVVQQSFEEVRFSDVLGDAGVFDGTSVAGVQDKASARMISVPVARAGQRFILKVDPPEFPFVVENEHYFLELARSAGMRTTHADIVTDAVGRRGLLVRRFDRVAQPDGSVRALAAEDACQLLNRWPADKYNVSAEEVVDAVAHVCPASPVAVRDVFQQFCFAWLTGNGDVHAKNISVLADGDGELRVSPAYDLPSTLPYRDLTMALPMAGSTTALSRPRLLDFASSIGMTSRASQRVLDDLLEVTRELPERLLGGALPFSSETTDRWVKQLRFRRRQLTT